MYWADELAARVSGPQVVNDSKTPSGTVHVGSLRGPVMHDAIARALRDRGIPVKFRYGVEDMDAMDAQALLGEIPLEASVAGSILVLKTLPGSAHAIAASLDRLRLPEIVGTVAGDDTLFVAVSDAAAMRKLRKRLTELAQRG